MHPEQPHTIVIVAATPAVADEALLAATFTGLGSLVGAGTVDDIGSGPGSTVIATLAAGGERTGGGFPSRRLAASITAELAGRGYLGRSVEVARLSSGAVHGPLRRVMAHWSEVVGAQMTVTAARHSFREHLDGVVSRRAIRTLFQPIMDIGSGSAVGYEALSRGATGSALQSPTEILDAARAQDMEDAISILMAQLARERAMELFDDDMLLFINMGPGALWQPTHPTGAEADRPTWPADRTVVEVTERVPIHDAGDFVSQRDVARADGVRFALDDSGAGYAGLATVALLAPDYVKVDMGLVRGCDTNRLKCATIDALAYLARSIGATLIAEGVETERELGCLREMGIALVQGYLIGRPAPRPIGLRGVPVTRRVARPQRQALEAEAS